MKTNKKGFTLIELLVVVLIIGVLAAVAIPGYRKSVEKAKAVHAVAVLNDAAKAEQDFILASSRYTKYWDDLVINQPNMVEGAVYCLQGENTANQDDCGNDSTYKVKLTVSNPENQSVVMATRMPNNPYGDYKLFKFMGGDPTIYCKAATTSQTDICQILGYPTKNLPETRNIDRQESINCATELHGNLSNASNYTCDRITYDDGSYEERAYKANGDLYDLFTFDSEGRQTGDFWDDIDPDKVNDNAVGIEFFNPETGKGTLILWAFNSEHLSDGIADRVGAHLDENGKRTDTSSFYPTNEIATYNHYVAGTRHYWVGYNEDGTVKEFRCFNASCGGRGNCIGEACSSSQYASYIPDPSTLPTYDTYFNEENISQICNFRSENVAICQ